MKPKEKFAVNFPHIIFPALKKVYIISNEFRKLDPNETENYYIHAYLVEKGFAEVPFFLLY